MTALPTDIAADAASLPGPITPLPTAHRAPATAAVRPPLGALSRVRGGTYSPTIEQIRFTDGTTARTDLIRLNPGVDAYSLNFGGLSPRQLCHYREGPWGQAPLRAQRRQAEISAILANSYPLVATAELSRRLREAGYPLGAAELREHEAIAATQAAIWRFSNALELDTEPAIRTVGARTRIGEHPSSRPVAREAAGYPWHTVLPAGQTAYLEIEFESRPQLSGYSLTLGGRSARHEFALALEASTDGTAWRTVSSSATNVRVPDRRHVRRRLGHGATLADTNGARGQHGYRFYRLAVTGPADRDSLFDIQELRLEPAAAPLFHNSERVVYLYQYLVALASQAPGSGEPSARVLVGSRTPTGASEFTPLVVADPPPNGKKYRLDPPRPAAQA